MTLDISFRVAQPTDEQGDLIALGLWAFTLGRRVSIRRRSRRSINSSAAASRTSSRKRSSRAKKISRSAFPRSAASAFRASCSSVSAIADKQGTPRLRTFGAKAARIANGEKAKEARRRDPDGAEVRLRAIAEGLELGAYRFTKYLTGDRKPKETLASVVILSGKKVGVNGKRDIAARPRNRSGREPLAAISRTSPRTR